MIKNTAIYKENFEHGTENLLITGVSSGFGNKMTKQLLEKGDTVIEMVRNTRKWRI